jgi:hypothetical protein
MEPSIFSCLQKANSANTLVRRLCCHQGSELDQTCVPPAEMITAHASYWADSNFASFLLAEIFAKKEDRARTGLGLGMHPPHTNQMEIVS